jgi:hypothetical protein
MSNIQNQITRHENQNDGNTINSTLNSSANQENNMDLVQIKKNLKYLIRGIKHKDLSPEGVIAAVNVENQNKYLAALTKEQVTELVLETLSECLSNELTSDDLKDSDITYSVYYPGIVDTVVDSNQSVLFLEKQGGQLVTLRNYKHNGLIHIAPNQNFLQWMLPRLEKVKQYFYEDTDLILYQDLVNKLKCVSEMPTEEHYSFLAIWIMTSYLWDLVDYLPILYFYAVAARGKTRTGKFLTHSGFHGNHVITVREAHLIRLANDDKATLFFDMSDLEKHIKRNASEDILLNRYERGGCVIRIAKNSGKFYDKIFYQVYGPTIIAANEPINDILETRAIQIIMPESIRDFDESVTPDNCLEWRERLVAFRARNIDRTLPHVTKPVHGRLGDIMRPLRQVIHLLAIQEEWFLNLVKEVAEDRKVSFHDIKEVEVLRAILEARNSVQNGRLLHRDTLLFVNKERQKKDWFNPITLGRIVVRLGFKSCTTGSHRGIHWDEQILKKLCNRYGVKFE